MTSKYLKCDRCGKTLGAEEVVKHRPPDQSDTEKLIDAAREAGWTGEMSPFGSRDLCPDCSAAPHHPGETKP